MSKSKKSKDYKPVPLGQERVELCKKLNAGCQGGGRKMPKKHSRNGLNWRERAKIHIKQTKHGAGRKPGTRRRGNN